MIMNQVNGIVKKLVEILGSDPTLKRLLFYAEDNKNSPDPSLEQLINDRKINDYPVVLNEQDNFTFISVNHDNTVLAENNVYASTYKVSCGVSKDAWHTADGNLRVMQMADRIEELLSKQRIMNSTGEFALQAITTVYWNSFVTGLSLIFQVVEQGDINEVII